MSNAFDKTIGKDRHSVFVSENNKVYTVEFILNNEVISTQSLNHGGTATLPELSGTENYVFTVDGNTFTAATVITDNTKVLITYLYCLGVVNGDGVVDIYDSALIAKFAIAQNELTEQALSAADVNGDGVVDLYDASLIAKQALGA